MMNRQLSLNFIKTFLAIALVVTFFVFSNERVQANEPSLTDDSVSLVGLSSPSDDVASDSSCCYSLDSDSSFAGQGFGDLARQSHRHWLEQLSFLSAVDGSKQPQDYGVNADLGMRFRGQFAAPLSEAYGIGFQVGSAVTWTDNAVRVFELIGEDTDRFQNYTTVGLFQRVGRWGWGGVFDHLYQDGFDNSSLGQFRGRVSLDLTEQTQIGLTGRFRAFDDTAEFLGNQVTLRSTNQGSFFIRHYYESGVQFTFYAGLVDEHGESNAVTGDSPAHDDAVVFGADFYAPLNKSLALYGETNLVTPADTGTVDAFFGFVYYPFANANYANRSKWAPLLTTAAPTSFSVDLVP